MTGNAHTLTAGKRRACIHAELGHAADLVMLASKLRLALLEWKILLKKNRFIVPGRGTAPGVSAGDRLSGPLYSEIMSGISYICE
jgi:hypothetical protein